MGLKWKNITHGGLTAKLPNGWHLRVIEASDGGWFTDAYSGANIVIEHRYIPSPTCEAAQEYGNRLAKLIAKTPEFQDATEATDT